MFKKRVENRNFAKFPRNDPSFVMILELEVRTHYITHINLVAATESWDLFKEVGVLVDTLKENYLSSSLKIKNKSIKGLFDMCV